MAARRAPEARDKLLDAASDLFRRRGFVATSVDDICAGAGVTKGAFFHHFPSKEALAQAALRQWDERIRGMDQGASYQSIRDPARKLLAAMDFYIGVFSNAKMLKSCLAGTTVQECAHTHPALRDAAHACFAGGEQRFKALLDDAFGKPSGKTRKRPDTTSLARLWISALQGSIILAKASRDDSVIPATLQHVKSYIASLLPERPSK